MLAEKKLTLELPKKLLIWFKTEHHKSGKMRIYSSCLERERTEKESISLTHTPKGKLKGLAQQYYISKAIYWFRLVSLFNGISTFVGYLMQKPFS